MAEDTRADAKLTLAELCEAIAEGKVGYTVHDGCYQVKPTDARRLRLDQDDPLLDLWSCPEGADMTEAH
ncbi:MAG: hypothetical protein ACRDHP_07805 [Ktedonobacterales bacterium]